MVGVPSYDGHAYCRHHFLEALAKIDAADTLIVYNGNDPWGFDNYRVITIDDSRYKRGVDLLRDKENIIRDEFLKSDCTHLLMLESDNIPPDNVVETLLSHDKPIATGFYFLRAVEEQAIIPNKQSKLILKKNVGSEPDVVLIVRTTAKPVIMGYFRGEIFDGNAVRGWTMDDWLDAKMKGIGLVPITAGGLGCVLIRREVMEAVRFVGGENGFENHLTDYVFYMMASKAGFNAYCDLDCMVNHLHIQQWDDNNFKKWFDPDTLKVKEIQ